MEPFSKSVKDTNATQMSSSMKLFLRDVDPTVDPVRMQEIVTNHLLRGRQLSDLSAGEKKSLPFRVNLEYEHNIEDCLRIYHSQVKKKSKTDIHSALLLETAEKYANVDFFDGAESEDKSDDKVAIVDRPVATGSLTQLHIAAASGDLDRVIELVEKFGANLNAKDSGGLTPLMRAEMMGQSKVILYLRSKTKNS